MKKVSPTKKGLHRRAFTNMSGLDRIRFRMNRNIRNAIRLARKGEMIQERAISKTFVHWMTATPPVISPKPIMAPTTEWVVDTGNCCQVAKKTQKLAARRAASRPRATVWGSVRTDGSTMFFRMADVTCDPIKAAPTKSRIPAMNTACRSVMALAPTGAAMALATSLAPMVQAM